MSVIAQQESGEAPPLPLEKLEEGDAPEAPASGTRRADEQGRVIEKRARGGRVTEVEVSRGNRTYYLRPNTEPGSTIPGDAQSNTMRAPQWRLGEFDLRRPEQTKAEAAEAAADVPPPPAPTQPPRK